MYSLISESGSLGSVLITDQLQTRAARKADDRALNQTLVKLAQTLANRPDAILQTLVDEALKLCGAQSAGVSILTEIDGTTQFQWKAVAGAYAPLIWGTLPRDFSPCGTVLDTDAPQLMQHPERYFTYLTSVTPVCAEVLLIPFHIDGKPVGTVWAVGHQDGFEFDAGDKETLTCLSEFAAAAYKTLTIAAELKSALDLAQRNEELARSSMESSPDCVQVLDIEGRILSMNQNGCRLMEIDDFSTVINREWTTFWPESARSRAVSALEAAQRGEDAHFSGFSETSKGAEKFWEVAVSPIRDAAGKTARVLATSRDATLRRIEEARLREVAKVESLGILAGGIAHDFNNLLTPILGYASLLSESQDSGMAALARPIVDAAERAARLTEQILAYSGEGRFEVKHIDLSEAVREIFQLISPSINKNAEVILALGADLPRIEADPAQMSQLIVNLVINASEAITDETGFIRITTSVVAVGKDFVAQTFLSDHRSLSEGTYVCLEISDTGCGMNEETLTKMFDPFFTTKFTGRGLGLAAVSGIIRSHRGAIQATSKLDQGSTFRVFFPASREVPQKSGPERSSLSRTKRPGDILIVDDETCVEELSRTALENAGYKVLSAKNGKEAVAIFNSRSASIRLIVLDLTMPEMGGDRALIALRAIDPQIPILLSSGYNEVEVARRFTSDCPTAFLQKPYTARQLITCIARILD